MESLFSYGTLREEGIQRAVFGRSVAGSPDILVGYRLTSVTITDPDAIETSGKAQHTILDPTGDENDQILEMVLSISAAELDLADIYEDIAYKRVRARLLSGGDAWVYVRA
jgi:hypothetical protein